MNYSSFISLMILVSAALFFLPSVLGPDLECVTCGSSLSPEQCNATQIGGAYCYLPGQGARVIYWNYCIALTAEFTNGTKIGIRGCRLYLTPDCNSSIACNKENEKMTQGARFKRCIAECCKYTDLCNQNLYPMLPPEPEPSSSHTTVMATSSINPTGITTDKKPEPTSKAAASVRSFQCLFISVLALFLYIM